MARNLINIYQFFKYAGLPEYLHVENHLRSKKLHSSHDWALLRYWGLIIQKPSEGRGESNTGCWKITKRGREFVERMITVPKHVFLFNQTFYGFSDERITIDEALTNKFSYAELMGYPEPDVKVKQLQLKLPRGRPVKV